MSTALASNPSSFLDDLDSAAEQIIEWVRQAPTAGQVNDVRAKVGQARAWAKVHKRVSETRLALLRVEVVALIRLHELDAVKDLSAHDRIAAEVWAGVGIEQFDALGYHSCTTAAGLAKKVNPDAFKTPDERRGESLARRPGHPDDWGDRQSDENRDDRFRVLGVLRQMIEDAIDVGKPFTVADIVNDALCEKELESRWFETSAQMDELEELDRINPDDPGIIEAFNVHADALEDIEAQQRDRYSAVRRSLYLTAHDLIRRFSSDADLKASGYDLPATITARVEGVFQRIPTATATLAHLEDALRLRDEQIEADIEARNRFAAAVEKARDACDGDYTARMGDLALMLQNGGDPSEY